MTAVLVSSPVPDWLLWLLRSLAPLFLGTKACTTRRSMNPASTDSTATLGPEVVQRIAVGDSQAFAELYDALSGALYSLALKILGDAQEAEDVLQSACLRMWDDAARYSPQRGTPFTWAYTITRSKALDRLRLRQRRAQLMEAGGMQALTQRASDTTAPAADVEVAASERATAVRSALGGLPEDQRTAIELAFFKGLTQHEIAARLGEPLGTVKARIRRGMLRLRAPLAKLL